MFGRNLLWTAALGGVGLLSLTATGCRESAYCFDDCESKAAGGTGGTTAGGMGGDDHWKGGTGGTGIPMAGTGGTPPSCTPTGAELCDGLDNNCDGNADEDFDFTHYKTCGDCATNCIDSQTGVKGTTDVVCIAPTPADGTTAGTCDYTTCSPGRADADGNRRNGCEAACAEVVKPEAEGRCGEDDDCNGRVDDGLDLCGVDNCGECGRKCVVTNGTARCVNKTPGDACTLANTVCEVAGCERGSYDIDGNADNGCEYHCPVDVPVDELCDGIDNDCDGHIDNTDPDLETGDPRLGVQCFGGNLGECADAAHAGVSKCVAGAVSCCDTGSNDVAATNPDVPATGLRNGMCQALQPPFVLKRDQNLETCDGKDNDCDGNTDDSPIDEGGQCGSSVGSCQRGTIQCVGGSLDCVGSVGPKPDACNGAGADEDCDGVIDGVVVVPNVPCTGDAQCTGGATCRQVGLAKLCVQGTIDAGAVCDRPVADATGTMPCKAGVQRCLGASLSCDGSVGPSSSLDTCGVDANCDGALTNQPDFQNDSKNCGTCGNDCSQKANGQGLWSCQAGVCKPAGCRAGFIECGGAANDCETACNGAGSATELCNGVDDNCNCQIDENITTTPTPGQVCNVLSGATDAGCKPYHATTNPSGVKVTCSQGAWKCQFASGWCDNAKGPLYCSSTPDACDGKDNNCNGGIDDDFQKAVRAQGYLGQVCASDDGSAAKHGQCRTTGKYVCNGANSTKCNAVIDLTKKLDETCDGADNDCDGAVDEVYSSPGAQPSYVKPAVVKTDASPATWMFQYEASRPAATATNPGTGTPSLACSAQGKSPWANITPPDAAKVCQQMGGRLCHTSEWTQACQPDVACAWGYSPRAGACKAKGSYPAGTPSCNIGLYDFNSATPITSTVGPDSGLLPTGYTGGVANAPALKGCYADWGGLNGNPGASGTASSGIYDLLGNLREITYQSTTSNWADCNATDANDAQCRYPLMGGAYNTQNEAGATCNYSFYTVKSSFKLFDVGFRCCFDVDPR